MPDRPSPPLPPPPPPPPPPGGAANTAPENQDTAATRDSSPVELPAVARTAILFYALVWYGVVLGGHALANYALPEAQSWLMPLLFMAPILLRAWFAPQRLSFALFHRQWRGFLFSMLEGLVASALLVPWLAGVIWLMQSQPTWAQYLVGGTGTTDWPNFLAGMAAVAIGEELFFRAFLQHELSLALNDRSRLGCLRLGRGWLLATGLFALAHVVTQGAGGLLTFFPALIFGWLYARRQQVVGPAIFHFSCNILVAVAMAGGWY